MSRKGRGLFPYGYTGRIWRGEICISVPDEICCPNNLMGIYALANILLVSIGVLRPGWIGLWPFFLPAFSCH